MSSQSIYMVPMRSANTQRRKHVFQKRSFQEQANWEGGLLNAENAHPEHTGTRGF